MDNTGIITPDQFAALGIPELLATRSSNIHGIGFADGALYLKFQGGKLYRYTGEGIAQHAQAMLVAESAGSYFAKNLRANAAITCNYIGRVVEDGVQPERSPLADSIAPAPKGAPVATEHCACGARIFPGMRQCPACVPKVAPEAHENGDGV